MFAVIMAGGSGTRFWPLSRKHKPKQLLNITGRTPMLVETCDRLSPLARDEEMILILGREHLGSAKALFSGRLVHMLAEPVGRNTAPCIGLGAIYARHVGCSGSMAFLPADHYIHDPSAFLTSLSAAGKQAECGGIVTLGIRPTRPETGFGYIRRDNSHVDLNGLTGYRVSKFVEKPDPEKALFYFNSGEYYWNAGIFVAKPETILREIKALIPELYEGLLRLEKVLGTKKFEFVLDEVYDGIKGISFDYGVMEKTGEDVFVVPCECGWSDVGSWSSLYELRSADYDRDQNLAEGETLLIDCEGNFVSARSGRLVTCLGLKDCLVVDTPEALLVTHIDRAQDIRKIVDRLNETGKKELI